MTINKGTDVIIVLAIVLVALISLTYKTKTPNRDKVFYCVEGHKFVQSNVVEAILPIFDDNGIPVKCTEDGVMENGG